MKVNVKIKKGFFIGCSFLFSLISCAQVPPVAGPTQSTGISEAKEMMSAQLSFLKLGRDRSLTLEWLKKELEKKGFSPGSYKISPGQDVLHSDHLELIQLVNSMRAFYEDFEAIPYVKVLLQDAQGKESSCVALRNSSLLASWHWDQKTLPVETLGGDQVKRCQVQGQYDALYKNLDRNAVRTTFFTVTGALKVEAYPQLNHNLEFISFLIDRGFYAMVGDESGDLVIE